MPSRNLDFQIPRLDRRDVTLIQFNPSTTSCSRPRVAVSRAATNAEERPASLAPASSIASTMPETPSRPRRQSANAPTPGGATSSAAARPPAGPSPDSAVHRSLARGALEGLPRRSKCRP